MMAAGFERNGGIIMAQNDRRQKSAFRRFESIMTRGILGTLTMFLLMLVSAAAGIAWLKWTLAILVFVLCAAGTALLVLKQEHRRRRSWWMLASFIGLFACTLVSILVGFPAPIA